MGIKKEEIDVTYIKGLIDNLSETSKKQGEILVELRGIAIETKTMLHNQAETQKVQGRKLEEQSVRIRAVERTQDSCRANEDIGALKKQLNKLLAFKDMITSRAEEDTSVIDVHAQRMKHAVDAAMAHTVPYKILIWKMLPWFIIVFIVGIVSATLVATKAFSGEPIQLPDQPVIQIKTNLSSQDKKK